MDAVWSLSSKNVSNMILLFSCLPMKTGINSAGSAEKNGDVLISSLEMVRIYFSLLEMEIILMFTSGKE